MYSITIYDGPNDTNGMLIHSPYVDDLKVKFNINLVLQGISDMSFDINVKSPAWNRIKPLTTLIKVVDVRKNQTVFDGRILKPLQAMTATGHLSIKYVCESKLAYLNDSRQRHGQFQDITIRDFFAHMINTHNSKVEPHKRFKVGDVTVVNNTDNVYRYVGYESTFAEIKDNLIDRLGGFLVLREEEDGTYIDYLESVGEVKTTPIRLRTNLKDMRREIEPTDIVTRIIPLGQRLEDEGEYSASTPRLDITSVNDGVDYLEDPDLVEEFEIIEGTITFDDVTTPSILKLRGEQFFADQKAAKVSYDVTPLNLHLIDTSFDSFELGNWHPIENPLFEIEENLQIIEKHIDGNSPQQDRLTIGEKYRTLSEYQAEANKRARKIVDLESDIERQAQTMNILRVELSEVNEAVQQVKFELEEGDLPALEGAIENLNAAVDNLITAIDDIPIYDVATTSTDGLMSAGDKSAHDGMKVKTELITVSNQINLDQLYEKLSLITVVSAVDLNDLVERVEALENGNTEEPPETE